MTKYEKAIYHIIHTSSMHLTAGHIFELLKKEYPKVVLATVYNNLNKLWESGLIRKITLEGMPEFYDRTGRHDHLICRQCGEIADISLKDLTASLRDRLGESYLSYDLIVYYLCPNCRKI